MKQEQLNFDGYQLTERQKVNLKFRPTSEFIKEEQPDIIVTIDWSNVHRHPIKAEQQILEFLRSNQIPVIGEFNIEGIQRGRSYWDDFLDIGSRIFFYYRNEPTYTLLAKDPEYGGCRLICPICKELCGGILEHIEESGSPYHGCMHEHTWLALKDKEKATYYPIDWPIIGGQVQVKIEKEEEEQEEIEQEIEPLERTIQFEKK